MQEAPQLNHVRVDDIPLLIGILMQMNVPQIYDREIGDHGLHSGLSSGWLFSVWAVFVLSQGDHAKSHVMEWVRSHAAVLQQITGQAITAEEFNDTR
ncbi:MAG: transposase, partial [Chloroflexi bacterium]|nr:transposase [Chloroflexota bacterium]